MHQHFGIELKAVDAYEVQSIEQLLDLCGDTGTAAIIARTSLEQVVSAHMANQKEQELKNLLDELAFEAQTMGLDPAAYATEFAEGELGAAKDYAEQVRQLASGETLNPNEKSRRILNTQMLKIINDWRIFVERIRYMANQLVIERTECRVSN